MKAREWNRYLEEQRRRYGKYFFSITELANVSQSSSESLNVELARLREYGIIERYGRGIYGLPGIDDPRLLLPQLDHRAYITGSFALYSYDLIDQAPIQISAFTDRRHGSARIKDTSLGKFRFVTVKAPIYAPPKAKVIAGEERALADFFYICRRDGADPINLVSFRNLNRISPDNLRKILKNYPRTVARQLTQNLEIHRRPASDRPGPGGGGETVWRYPGTGD